MEVLLHIEYLSLDARSTYWCCNTLRCNSKLGNQKQWVLFGDFFNFLCLSDVRSEFL